MAHPSVEDVRAACRWVADVATHVRIDFAQLPAYAARLAESDWSVAELHPTFDVEGDDASRLAFAVTMGAINFGSGWHPVLRKRAGLSGSLTIATGLKERFRASGALTAGELAEVDAAQCAMMLNQDPSQKAVAELMALYASSWNDLGRFLLERFDGSFVHLVEAARGSAVALVTLLIEMPSYGDVTSYRGREVAFLKRAQLTAADVGRMCAGGVLAFDDLDRLTAFADNLVPHVLRVDGVLVYAPRLQARIDAEKLIPAGAPEECEIRAAGVHAVELLVALLAECGRETTPMELDAVLWGRGQQPAYKALRRHRTRTIYY